MVKLYVILKYWNKTVSNLQAGYVKKTESVYLSEHNDCLDEY